MVEEPAVHQAVIGFFKNELGLEIPSVQTDLIDEGFLDSLIFVQLVVFIENTFSVTVAMEDLDIDSFRSVARIGEFVKSRAVA